MTDERGQTSHAQENKANMKPISPFSLVLPNSEIRREFAPYLGVEWARKFGETEDFVRAAGEDTSDTRFVAGLRFWF